MLTYTLFPSFIVFGVVIGQGIGRGHQRNKYEGLSNEYEIYKVCTFTEDEWFM